MLHAPAQQSGMVLMTAVLLLIMIPTAVMLLHEKSSAIGFASTAEGNRIELDYVLDAAVAQARYLADQNDTCANFSDMPVTRFGSHSYQATVFQHTDRADVLYLNVAATLVDGTQASRLVRHTAYQPAITGSLSTDADMTISDANPDTSFGSEASLMISNESGNQSYGLLTFALPGTIPPFTKIDSALLDLTVESATYVGAIGAADWLQVHSLARKWKETGNWNTHDGNKAWRALGAAEPDHADIPLATWQGIPLTSVSIDLTSAIQRWANKQYTFYGMLLKSAHDPMTLTVASRESGNFDSRPSLDVTYACPCAATCLILPRQYYRDNFQPQQNELTGLPVCDTRMDYRGSSGDVRWTFNPWQEIGDDGQSCSGEIKLAHDPILVDPDAHQLKFTANNKTLRRQAWLEGAGVVTVGFRYRRQGSNNANQRIVLKAANGGGYTTLLAIGGGVTDSDYQSVTVEVPASLVGAQTTFELYSENLTQLSHYYLDDFEIGFEGSVSPPATLPIQTDSYLDEDKWDDKLATANPLRLRDGTNERMRIIATVNTAGLYDGEVVNRATLRLWVDDNRTDREATLTFYALTESWHESDVTWKERQRNVIAWAQPGGTHAIPGDPADIPTVILPEDAQNLWVEFDITPYVQSWADFPVTNFGVVIMMDDTGRGKEVKISGLEAGDPLLHPHVELQL